MREVSSLDISSFRGKVDSWFVRIGWFTEFELSFTVDFQTLRHSTIE